MEGVIKCKTFTITILMGLLEDGERPETKGHTEVFMVGRQTGQAPWLLPGLCKTQHFCEPFRLAKRALQMHTL